MIMSHHKSHYTTHILPHHRFSHSLGFPLARVKASIETVFGGPANHHGANHQHFTVKINSIVRFDGGTAPPVGTVVFVAVRFGDSEGLDSEIVGLAAGKPIELQGEYIDAAGAYPTEDNTDPVRPVLHFTHHPVGFVDYDGTHYS
jgi:hypothetical protein